MQISIIVQLLFITCLISLSLSDDKPNIFNNPKEHIYNEDKDVNKLYKENNDVKYSQTRLGFIRGFMTSIYVIIISELGDKTFFIVAIMSIRNPRLDVYAGAMLASAFMTVLSAALGMATTVVPRAFMFYISGILFLLFGLKMIKEACEMSPSVTQDEYKEVQEELRKRDTDYAASLQLITDLETKVLGPCETKKSGVKMYITSKFERFQQCLYLVFSKIFVESFVLTFLAEWGDRSQMTTLVLAATKDVVGVIVGGTLGHALCTGVAVISGRFIAQKIPVRALTFIGGVTFLIFALHTFATDPQSNS